MSKLRELYEAQQQAGQEPDTTEVRNRVLSRTSPSLRELYEDQKRQTRPVAKEPSGPVNKGESELTGRQRRFSQSLKRQVKKTEIQIQNMDEKVPEKKEHRGFWWALDMLDRPRNAVHNILLGISRGENSIKDVAENFAQGVTAEERANFEMLMNEWIPEADMAVRLPFLGAEVSDSMVRKLIGFGGDVFLDPLNYIPGAWIKTGFTKTAKGARIISEATPGVRTVLPKAENVLKKMFVNGTGLPHLDDLQGKRVDLMYAHQAGLAKDAQDLARKAEPFRKEHRGLIHKLSEETDVDDAFLFAASMKSTPDAAMEALKDFKRFRNPGAVGELMLMDLEDIEKLQGAVTDYKAFGDKVRMMQEATGKVVGDLGSQVTKKMNWINKEIAKRQKNIILREAEKVKLKTETAETALWSKKKMLRTVMGDERFKQLGEFIKRQSKNPARIRQRRDRRLRLQSCHGGVPRQHGRGLPERAEGSRRRRVPRFPRSCDSTNWKLQLRCATTRSSLSS